MHFLFERAGFNRWSPAMEGKRNQGVLHKYLMEAAEDVLVKGVTLGERLYVPEHFSEQRKADAAQRRRAKLAILSPHDGHWPWPSCWASSRRTTRPSASESGSGTCRMCRC
jgi:hypothetical protein